MLLAPNIKMILLAAGFAGPLAMTAAPPAWVDEHVAAGDRPALVELQPGNLQYRAAGDFTRSGKPAEAPLTTIRIAHPLVIMKHQVSSADYQRCVTDGACRGLSADAVVANDRPVVQVSWRDADAYAAWLSRKTGETYRLPTDEEWAYAAGSRYRDDGLPVDENDPSRRWLARYEREANLRASDVDSEPRPFGGFGTNEHGLLDVGGNVWEWTNTCFVRTTLDAEGKPGANPTANCGVRVVEGQHRSYVSDFIRDARAGGCAAGIPPANLGFRLVRDQASWRWQGIVDLISNLPGWVFMKRD
jgi:formylglycine-generating enzyme required for sulfatase activity